METFNGYASSLRGLNKLKDVMAESEYEEFKKKLGWHHQDLFDWNKLRNCSPPIRPLADMTDADLLSILTDQNFSIVSQSSEAQVSKYTLMRK